MRCTPEGNCNIFNDAPQPAVWTVIVRRRKLRIAVVSGRISTEGRSKWRTEVRVHIAAYRCVSLQTERFIAHSEAYDD